MSEETMELTRAIDSIRIGRRLRDELGDLTELMDSIAEIGLLQPVTITPDGWLILGLRRLEACRGLGHRSVKVRVRSGLSTQAQQLLAQQHENTLRKGFTPTEAARIYRELKDLYQDETRKNMAATQFGEHDSAEGDGVPTVGTPVGNAAKKAALAVTGTRSDVTHERVLEVERLAGDPEQPEELREFARQQLELMDEQRTVTGPYAQVKAAEAGRVLEELIAEPELPVTLRERTAEALHRLEQATTNPERLTRAREAMRHAKAARSRTTIPSAGESAVRTAPAEPRRYSVRAMAMLLRETDFWWLHYDPVEVGRQLSDEQWERFGDWIAQSTSFYTTAREARSARPA